MTPAKRTSYTFREGLTMMAAKDCGIDPELTAEAGDTATAVLNAIRRARKAKTPAQKAEHVRAAQDELRRISPRQHPELVSAIQAKLLALQGRGGDTEIAHVTPGEVVIPRNLQTPAVMRTLAAAAARAGIDPRRYTVGHRANSVNPRTGKPEFAIEEIVVTHPGYRNRGGTGGGSFTLPASFSYYDTIEGGIEKTLKHLKELGFEILPDGRIKTPDGRILEFGTQIVRASTTPRPKQDKLLTTDQWADKFDPLFSFRPPDNFDPEISIDPEKIEKLDCGSGMEPILSEIAEYESRIAYVPQLISELESAKDPDTHAMLMARLRNETTALSSQWDKYNDNKKRVARCSV
ncbi:MAG: hypothetical protein SFV19_06645 [Rhodospirillaceae bacterium]|nr:hypothetical protein [Rhodospirillaceae bacterium]